MRTLVTAAAALAVFASLALTSAASTDAPNVVADSALLYAQCGRVYSDPHAYWPAPPPVQGSGRSPFAKGIAACAATDFISYAQLKSGMEFMAGGSPGPAGLFPQFLEFYNLERDFGGNSSPCATSTNPSDYCSVGLPQGGVSGTREKVDLHMIRVTDERVPNTNKKYFVFPLSIHGIERAGAEAGGRAAEDLATWAYCEARANNEIPSNGLTQCNLEGTIPHPLLEAQPAGSKTAGEVLKQSVIYFVFPNPDGWRRGDPDNIARSYQRYNGNGVDMNRDWPTLGFTFRPFTPWSEPETRSFGEVLKNIKARWDGGIDLHGQLIDRAFSFTLLGASQRDYAKDQRILQTVKGAHKDAEARLSWSPLIKPNDAPPQCPDVPPGDPCDNRIWGVQWGTVWDSIAYQVTGSFGDWIDSPIGLGADGIDNEMSLSHLSNCGTGTCYVSDVEQAHVDGNKSLVYAMLNFSLLPENTAFNAPGKVGYVLDPVRLVNPGNPNPTQPCGGLPPQPSMLNQVLDASNNFRIEFQVKGAADGFCNGGMGGIATPQGNLQGVGGQSLTSLVLERADPDEPPPVDDPSTCANANDDWEEVNRYYNQASTYVQSGQAVHGNTPTPGTYRICVTGSLPQQLAANGASVDLDILFASEQAWADPGQRAYNVSNMDFFSELAPYMQPGQLVSLDANGIVNGTVDLSQFASVVIADNPLPGLTPAQQAAWGAKLLTYVQGGGNLVLTDGALQVLGYMGVIPADQIVRTYFYAGYIAFTNNGGGTATYSDILAQNVNQPGAAEGDGHRHQTYEPVPLGMDLGDRSSCSGSQCTAPIWSVGQTAWQNAGGRTVGQSVNGRTTFGEIGIGTQNGHVRIIGALLPMPTEQYYHPFGLADYALTYTGFQVFKNVLQAGPTAVGVARFDARPAPRGVRVSWRTSNEKRIAGFNVWRGTGRAAVRLNRTLLPAKRSGRVAGAGYAVVDRSARSGRRTTYRLQVVDLGGRRAWFGSAVVTPSQR